MLSPVQELGEVPTAVVGGFDVHGAQITFDQVDTDSGEVRTGQVRPATRANLRRWPAPLARADVAYALEGCTGWRFVPEELHRAGVAVHLAEPADTAMLRGKKKRAIRGRPGRRPPSARAAGPGPGARVVGATRACAGGRGVGPAVRGVDGRATPVAAAHPTNGVGAAAGPGWRAGPGPPACRGVGGLASEHAQLVTEHRDLDVLVVVLRPVGEEAKDSTNEREHYRRAHTDDLAKPASRLLAAEILYLHPSGLPPVRKKTPLPATNVGTGTSAEHCLSYVTYSVLTTAKTSPNFSRIRAAICRRDPAGTRRGSSGPGFAAPALGRGVQPRWSCRYRRRPREAGDAGHYETESDGPRASRRVSPCLTKPK
jgi:hypothetical protein